MVKDFEFKKQRISEIEYKKEEAKFRQILAMLQQKIKEKNLPVILLLEGLSAAGKGNRIADVIAHLDPRFYKVYSIIKRDAAEKRKPLLWRYFIKTPPQGQIAIFDQSWYQDVLQPKAEEEISKKEYCKRMESIRVFERQIADDGCLILKFFLHISKKEQKERLKNLAKKKSTSWRATPSDKKQNKHYDSYIEAADEILNESDFSFAPWHVIDGTSDLDANLEIFKIVTEEIEAALNGVKKNSSLSPSAGRDFPLVPQPRLEEISLDKKMSSNTYRKMLEKYQTKLLKLHNKVYLEKKPVILVFEGWDAAGKGGAIKRVATALDPRGCTVNPVAAPSKDEFIHHYLWRFWNQIPKDGHIAIFDRSWYGRVMVERIEGFCSEEAWKRAYQEINEFEYELHKWGAVILKFWIQIDPQEQLRRFKERQETPAKRWKITDEDWRNREKWPQYEDAVNEMIRRTSTKFAPWHIIQGNNKRYGRIQTLSIIIDRLEKELN